MPIQKCNLNWLKISLFLSLLVPNTSNAQSNQIHQIISASGQSFENNKIFLDYTIGEIAITTLESPTQLLTQGFHQPISITKKSQEITDDLGTINVINNQIFLEIKADFHATSKLSVYLIDVLGQILWQNNFEAQNILFEKDINDLPSAVYFVSFIVNNQQYYKTIKIIKY